MGTFDRPNLVYRVIPQIDVYTQTLEALRRHPGQAAIVYCLSRNDTEQMAEFLKANRIKAAPYHAGLNPEQRRKTQEAFAEERLDVVAATVAFGMGIDRGDVRCVVHATMPKSIEHYQQETGRAGRDGLEAECVLFYSVCDVIRWEGLISKNIGSIQDPQQAAQVELAMRRLLEQMQRLCSSVRCRHRALSEHFGQSYAASNCGACDVCLEEMEAIPDSTVVAQKILSCVARVREGFGAGHVTDVLLGANTERIRQLGHDQLSTYGLLKDEQKASLMNLVNQLIDQRLLDRSTGDYPILRLNAASWEVMRGSRPVRLVRPKGVKRTRAGQEEWTGVDQGLFEALREHRRDIAAEHSVPAYVVLGDKALRELARARPSTPEALETIRGFGMRKATELGGRFVERIHDYCREHSLATDVGAGTAVRRPKRRPRRSDRIDF